ncbi:signal transducer and activator of transcription 6 isoform X2 [Pleurodeles waltl]|uniref:signal transducer and activator of transcription 6 isoform X2 n=1 Tax=Pleurodeles waltl TaxID=8319 RepID=UPI00370951E9
MRESWCSGMRGQSFCCLAACTEQPLGASPSAEGHDSKMSKSSLWSLVSKMPPERFSSLYLGFPRNIRHLLADWLENQPWMFLDCADPFCLSMAVTILASMVDELRSASQHCSNKDELLQQADCLEGICKRDPQQMVETFKGILEREKAAVIEQFRSLPINYYLKQEELKFRLETQNLHHKLGETQVLLDRLGQATKVTRSSPPDVEGIKLQLTSLIMSAVTLLESMQAQVLKRIHIWKRQQQLSGNGAPFSEDLSHIQEKCEILFDIHICLSQELMKTSAEVGTEAFTELPKQLSNSLITLVKSSLIVDKQPPQVLKTQTKFQAGLRFFLGSKLLDNQDKMPSVKASIITEKQAREMVLRQSVEAWTECAGEIVNNTATLEKHLSSKVYGAVFKNLSVKKIKRCERKGSESVTEEKCAILFTVKFNHSTFNMAFHVEALSLPLVVIVHGNQDNNAKATILWDNAFAEGERLPFIVSERVPWPKMCETLNLRFVSEVGTSQGLLSEHFIFLAQKVFNDNSLNAEDFQHRSVSWSQFNKELLPGRSFTFWQWFDGVVELSKKCLKNYWSDKLIIGFISKQYVHKLLCSQPDGTFILRFSDSEIGGITIAHILRNQEGAAQIQNIQPFTAHDLGIRTLGDRIKDLTQLKYLYKQKLKDEAFQKHYTKQPTTKTDGYTPASIIMAVNNAQGQSKPSDTSISPKPEMGAHQQDSPVAQSPVYPSPMICSQNPNIVMGSQVHLGNLHLPFPGSYPDIQVPVAHMTSPSHLTGTCDTMLSGSPSPAYSPVGSMNPNTASPLCSQYPDLMQVDPPQFQTSMMLSEMGFNGMPLSNSISETTLNLDDIIDDLIDMAAFPGVHCTMPSSIEPTGERLQL